MKIINHLYLFSDKDRRTKRSKGKSPNNDRTDISIDDKLD